MSDEIPAGCKGCPASFLVQRTGCAVHREARLQATRVESLQKSPEPDSHPVFVPRPIWHVGQERLAHGRGQHCPRHGISRAPVLHVHDCPDRHPRISGQTQLRARHDWPIRKAVANCRRHYRGVPKSPTGNWSTGLVGPDSPEFAKISGDSRCRGVRPIGRVCCDTHALFKRFVGRGVPVDFPVLPTPKNVGSRFLLTGDVASHKATETIINDQVECPTSVVDTDLA